MVDEGVAALSSVAQFFRGDLHIHSHGASYDVTDATATPDAIVATAKKQGLSIIALADHNEIANVAAAIEAGQAHGVFVLPGVELSTPEGHLLCYAPTADALERFFNRLQIADRRTANCRCQTGALQCLELLEAEGGFGVLAHVELNGAFESNLPRFTPAKMAPSTKLEPRQTIPRDLLAIEPPPRPLDNEDMLRPKVEAPDDGRPYVRQPASRSLDPHGAAMGGVKSMTRVEPVSRVEPV